MCPERRRVHWMQNLFTELFEPCEPEGDLFSGAFPDGKKCLETARHRPFMGCNVDGQCFTACAESLVETFTGQTLMRNSDISRSRKGLDACETRLGRCTGCELRSK